MTTPTALPAHAPAVRTVPSVPPVPRHPRADCTADSAGGLTFDVRLPAVSLDAVRDAALLLRRRGGEEGADTVRLPLTPAGSDSTLRAVLPSIMTLPEGRWDAYLLFGGSGEREPRRLLPGIHDLRSLIGRVPRSSRTWLGVRIPYTTKYGNLTVRSWLRWPHAEAGELRVADGGIALHGRLYGARLGGTARLEACARDAAATPISVPVAAHAADAPHTADVTGQNDGQGSDFTAWLPLAALSAAHPVWDLWLRPWEGAEPVRIGRILDDVADKKRIFSYPPQRVADADGERAVSPYYTRDNDLSVRVSRVDAR
ncbi:MAG: hypothetical protein ACRDP3_01310 [Streptomyces sp.]|uniref:hypothetical protein n=1 Tax=Streptomyces sp. TaxID=1931 RepID=UPI003D6BB81A